MSKRKLSFKEREELQPKNKPEKKSKERLNVSKDAREEKQPAIDEKESARNSVPTLAPTDWSVIPSVDWDSVSLPDFERNFLTSTKNNTNSNASGDSSRDSALRLEHSVEISIICGPSQEQNLAPNSLSAMPFFATFADERIPSPLRQYLALASQSSNSNESSDGKEQKKKEKEFRRPTAVQSQAWGLALSGENFVATAQTGRCDD